MAKADLDKSQLDRQLLGDLAALIAVHSYLTGNPQAPNFRDRTFAIQLEIESLVNELWPTG